MARKTTVLLVGCGSIGKRHARLLTEQPEVEVLVCDALEENLKLALEEAPGSRGFSDLRPSCSGPTRRVS